MEEREGFNASQKKRITKTILGLRMTCKCKRYKENYNSSCIESLYFGSSIILIIVIYFIMLHNNNSFGYFTLAAFSFIQFVQYLFERPEIKGKSWDF